MKDIKLTINGNREIPMSVDDGLLKSLMDTNHELSFIITVSPDKIETVLSHNELPNEMVAKVRLLTIEPLDNEV